MGPGERARLGSTATRLAGWMEKIRPEAAGFFSMTGGTPVLRGAEMAGVP